MSATQEEEQKRRRKLEEALEVRSLRRIISAYLNYQDAAEQDVIHYERSFRKLPPPHKALLSHLPKKYLHLRRCVAANTHFILSMLQTFEPPLDLSLEVDSCEDHNLVDEPRRSHIHPERMSSAPNDSKEITSFRGSDDQSACGIKSSLPEGNANVKEEQMGSLKHEEELCQHAQSDTSSVCCPDISYAGGHPNGNVISSSHGGWDHSDKLDVPLVDVDKVRCIIRNIVRDWAAEGQVEREQCYNPILEELQRLFPLRSKDSPPTCLVPGAGLGRLALEISRLGFVSQGNEFSYYMMICSSFILNYTQTVGEWTLYPWIHSNCNSLSDKDQLRPVSIPDILPATAGITEGFSMCGGDFVEVYNEPEQEGAWDVVVTCFFIDTAHNIVEYMETIWKILKDGGVWINLGPLLYHFADLYGHENEMSIELSLEDVKKVALQIGFQLEKETTIETTYTTNPRSMMQNRYYAAFWTMKKPGQVEVGKKHDNGNSVAANS